jgi:hypothetical protein
MRPKRLFDSLTDTKNMSPFGVLDSEILKFQNRIFSAKIPEIFRKKQSSEKQKSKSVPFFNQWLKKIWDLFIDLYSRVQTLFSFKYLISQHLLNSYSCAKLYPKQIP